MNVQELVVNIQNEEFDIEKALDVKKYLPIELKKTIAQSIIYECTENDSGAIKVDSVQRYLSYLRYMITSHTNLQYTDADYDTLCSIEYVDGISLLNVIMSLFESDAKQCDTILDFMFEDYMQEMSIEYTIAKFIDNLNDALNGLVGTVNEKLDGIDLKSVLPDDIPIETLMTVLKK